MGELDGRVALVMGYSKGLGAAPARLFAGTGRPSSSPIIPIDGGSRL
jgi:hypothetical protein